MKRTWLDEGCAIQPGRFNLRSGRVSREKTGLSITSILLFEKESKSKAKGRQRAKRPIFVVACLFLGY